MIVRGNALHSHSEDVETEQPFPCHACRSEEDRESCHLRIGGNAEQAGSSRSAMKGATKQVEGRVLCTGVPLSTAYEGCPILSTRGRCHRLRLSNLPSGQTPAWR